MGKSGNNPEPEMVGDLVSIYKRNDTWYANWQFEGKQNRRSLGTKSKKEARRKAVLLESEIVRGDHSRQSKKKQSKVTLEEACAVYLKHCETERRAKKTLTKYRYILENAKELARELSVTSVMDLDIKFIDEYRHRRVVLGRATKTIYNETMIIRQVVNHAISRGMIHEDPLANLRLKKPKPTTQPCWTRDEAELILSHSNEPRHSILTVLADTGARVGEIKWLTWDDVDFQRNVLHIRPKEGWQPKTGDQRAIPMTSRIAKLLKARRRNATWVFTAAPSTKYPDGDHQFSERRLLQYLKRVLKPLNLKGHLHTFRHTFISHAITTGIPSEVVRGMVGHVDEDILRLYTHIADQRKQSAIERFENATDGPSETPKPESSSNGNSSLGNEVRDDGEAQD